MFLLQAPQVRELDVFSRMPEAHRRRTRSVWADANRGGQITDSFLEGPVFDDAGNLLVRWDDGKESKFGPKWLRGRCPCAECVEEWSGKRVVGGIVTFAPASR